MIVKFMYCLPVFNDLKTTVGQEILEKYGLKGFSLIKKIISARVGVIFFLF